MAERFFDPNAVMFDMDGVTPCAGGTITFSESGTSTPKDVFGDIDLSTNNGNVIDLGVDGRPEVEIFGEGAYRAILKNADGDTVWSRDNVILRESASEELNLPDYSSAEDGWVLQIVDGVPTWVSSGWALPDPTGNADKYVTTDGDVYLLTAPPEAVDPEITVDAGSFQAGVSSDNTKHLEQYGTGSASASGGKTTSASVTFSTEFAASPFVSVTPTTSSACGASGLVPSWAVTSLSATGFTVTFSTVTGGTSADNYSGSNITGSVTFMWKATGTVEVTP
jgi:hypothetical protein